MDDLIPQRRRQASIEVLELLLAVLRLLGVLQVADDVLLQLLRHVHVLHGRVGEVNRFLELGVLLVQILNNQRHIAEDDRVDDGAERDSRSAEEDFPLADRSDVVAGQEEDGIVDGDEVLPHD